MANECNGHNVLRGSFSQCYKGALGLTLLHTKIHILQAATFHTLLATEKEITSTFNDLARVSDIIDLPDCLLYSPTKGSSHRGNHSIYLSPNPTFLSTIASRSNHTITFKLDYHVQALRVSPRPSSSCIATFKLDAIAASQLQALRASRTLRHRRSLLRRQARVKLDSDSDPVPRLCYYSSSSSTSDSDMSSPREKDTAAEDAREQPPPVTPASTSTRPAGPGPELTREEEAYQEALLETFQGEMRQRMAMEHPGDPRKQELSVMNAMALARRRVAKRQVAESLCQTLRAKLKRFGDNLLVVMRQKDDNGVMTPDGISQGEMFLQKWEEELQPKVLDVKARLDGSYFGYDKTGDELSAALDDDHDALLMALGPLRRATKKATPPRATTPTSTPATPAAPATPAVVTARAFVVKDYVPVPFTGEGNPQDILGGFRSWEAEWEDARRALDKCPGATAPIRLTKLQLALGGAALKLVKSIPAGTDDGYDLAMKKLKETYHNPVGLATALLNAAETEKKPRIHQETDAHVKSLRAAMLEEEVTLETFYYLHPILKRLSSKDAASWNKWIVSQRTRFNTEQQRLAADDRKPWRVGMAYNLESFSNWREETVPDQEGEAAEDAGIHLAGSRYPTPSSSNRGGCALHGWVGGHHSRDCLVLRNMDGETWVRTALAMNACVKCGEQFRRGHQCPSQSCSLCHQSGHSAFRCRHREEDREAIARTPSLSGPSTSSGAGDRRRHQSPGRGPHHAPKRARSLPRDKGRKGERRTPPAGSGSGASQPPAPSPQEGRGRQRGGKGRKHPAGGPAPPRKE